MNDHIPVPDPIPVSDTATKPPDNFPLDDTEKPGICVCAFAVETDDPDGDDWHFKRRCAACQAICYSLHCPHDGVQSRCSCGARLPSWFGQNGPEPAAYPSLVSKLQATEAENKRLREALEGIADWLEEKIVYSEGVRDHAKKLRADLGHESSEVRWNEYIKGLKDAQFVVSAYSQPTRTGTENADGPTAEVATGEASENREGEGK